MENKNYIKKRPYFHSLTFFIQIFREPNIAFSNQKQLTNTKIKKPPQNEAKSMGKEGNKPKKKTMLTRTTWGFCIDMKKKEL